MSMNVGGSKGGAIADINVTPMADIMIVLLIIFMVITPMLQKGIDVKLPTARPENIKERKEEQKTIVVAIKNDNDKTTYLGGLVVANRTDLVTQVKERLEDLPEDQKLVFLKGDRELPYSEVMKVMDLLREAGVEEIALIAEQRAGA
jgi:biopolymer transport protein TolR